MWYIPSLWKIHVVIREKEIQNLLSDLCPFYLIESS